MVKWVTSWTEAQTYKDSVQNGNGSNVFWAITMPKTYPECRVTRAGIANIAVTNDEMVVAELSEDGGEAQIIP